MAVAHFRFYEELNDFLPRYRQKTSFEHEFGARTSVKDMIESFGIPHTEVDLILVNGESVDFGRIIGDGDRVSVYPVFEAIDITPLVRLRPRPLRTVRFVVDANLGRLARHLRMLGFDTLYESDCVDREIARQSACGARVLLTRDRDLLKRRIVTHGYFVRNVRPRLQLSEVLLRLDLYRAIQPFSRCIACNCEVIRSDRTRVAERLERNTFNTFRDFWECVSCRRVYWRGSHYQRMQRLVQEIRREIPHNDVPSREGPSEIEPGSASE